MLRGLASTTPPSRRSTPSPAAAQAPLLTAADEGFADAEADYRKALELLASRPRNGEFRYALLVNRGAMWSLRERWDEAVADLTRRSGSTRRGTTWRRSALARVHQERGDNGRAFEAFSAGHRRRRPDLASLYRGRRRRRPGRGRRAA